jgi:hypothetical protein
MPGIGNYAACCMLVKAEALKETLHDDFIQFCIHQKARLQSVYSRLVLVGMTKVLKVSQVSLF